MTLFVFKITFILIFSSVIITIVLFYGDWIMNIFICDDDNLICEQIKTLCESYYIEHKLKRPDIYIFHSGEDILASDIKPDIVYLDIQMSGIDGIAKDIIMVEVNPHCRNLTIHTVSDTYTTTQTLASIKSMLPSGSFYQSHRCYIVNMNYIMSYNNSRIYMENHLYADIALRKYNDFFNTYSAFLTTLR